MFDTTQKLEETFFPKVNAFLTTKLMIQFNFISSLKSVNLA